MAKWQKGKVVWLESSLARNLEKALEDFDCMSFTGTEKKYHILAYSVAQLDILSRIGAVMSQNVKNIQSSRCETNTRRIKIHDRELIRLVKNKPEACTIEINSIVNDLVS